METKKIIEELELNYGYKFNPKEKHEFDWLCNLVKDVETVVSKNESLHLVSQRYTIEDIERCVENWGLCKVEKEYIEKFLNGG